MKKIDIFKETKRNVESYLTKAMFTLDTEKLRFLIRVDKIDELNQYTDKFKKRMLLLEAYANRKAYDIYHMLYLSEHKIDSVEICRILLYCMIEGFNIVDIIEIDKTYYADSNIINSIRNDFLSYYANRIYEDFPFYSVTNDKFIQDYIKKVALSVCHCAIHSNEVCEWLYSVFTISNIIFNPNFNNLDVDSLNALASKVFQEITRLFDNYYNISEIVNVSYFDYDLKANYYNDPETYQVTKVEYEIIITLNEAKIANYRTYNGTKCNDYWREVCKSLISYGIDEFYVKFNVTGSNFGYFTVSIDEG